MEKNYWNGRKNHAIRWYFYSQRGLQLFNEFRYLLLLIFGIYAFMKLQNPIYLIAMFLVALPILIIVGFLQVHHMAPVINWLDITYGSYWSKKSMEWQERQVHAAEQTAKNTADIAGIATIASIKPLYEYNPVSAPIVGHPEATGDQCRPMNPAERGSIDWVLIECAVFIILLVFVLPIVCVLLGIV